MTSEANVTHPDSQKSKVIYRNSASEAVYGLGLIGAWIYYFSHATSIWVGILGLFKGIFWPAMLVYEALKFLNS